MRETEPRLGPALHSVESGAVLIAGLEARGDVHGLIAIRIPACDQLPNHGDRLG